MDGLWKITFDRVRVRLRVAKIRLCLLVGLSTLFGYLMAAGGFFFSGALLGIAIFLLATGGATLNSWQERELDGRMHRTRSRPMVAGALSGRQALLQAILLVAAGVVLLTSIASFFVAIFGLAGLAIYNLIYTPLKKRTLLAIFPGAVCGAVPPCVGWLGGGGTAADYHFWLLFGLFFLWQMPHFWLVMMMHREDYIRGPYPSLLDRFPDALVKGFFIPWIGSLLIAMTLFSMLPELGFAGRVLIIINCIILGGGFVLQVGVRKRPAYRLLFIGLNIALVVHMSVVSLSILLQ